MKRMKPGFQDAAGLRRRAEKKVVVSAAKEKASLTPREARRTLHELHVHQVELELQNEELRRVGAELETARARYFDLYDPAPSAILPSAKRG